jgi:hypothetical protein
MKRSLVLLAFILVLSAMASARRDRQGSSGNPKTPSALIKQLQASGSVATRTRLARELAEFVAASPQAIGEEELRGMALLLDDPMGGVRAWAATAIGNLGVRGRDAVPALEAALKRQEAIDREHPVDLSPAGAMEAALKKIRLVSESKVDAGGASPAPRGTVPSIKRPAESR